MFGTYLAMHFMLAMRVESPYVSAVWCPCLTPIQHVGSTTAQYTLSLVASRTPRSLQRRLVNLSNEVSLCQSVPRYRRQSMRSVIKKIIKISVKNYGEKTK